MSISLARLPEQDGMDIEDETQRKNFHKIDPNASNGDEISLNYSLIYEIVTEDKTESDIVPLNLTIIGTNGLLENGTIEYSIPKNITDPSVLQGLSLIFFQEQIQYVQNHKIGESYKNFFSYRKEAMTNNPKDFEDNGSYTFFWIGDQNKPPQSILLYENFPFTRLNLNVPVLKDNILVSYPTWDENEAIFQQSQKALEAFYLHSFNSVFNLFEYEIRLYYDKTNAILLRAEYYYKKMNSDEIYYVDLVLRDSSIPLDLIDNGEWTGEINDEPILSHPKDMIFNDDSQDSHVIEWEIRDSINFFPSFTIYTKNQIFGPFLWDKSSQIQFNVSEFQDGKWTFLLVFEDGLGGTVFDTVQVDIRPIQPVLTSPVDLSYLSNSSSNFEIVWKVMDNSTYQTSYIINLEGISYPLKSDIWKNNDEITYDVSHLPKGTWKFKLTIDDGSSAPQVQDVVQVVVQNTTIDQLNRAPFIFHSSNLTFYEGKQFEKFLSWYPVDYNTTSTRDFSLYLNNTLLMNKISWSSQQLIQINISYLILGEYNYKINLTDKLGLYGESNLNVKILPKPDSQADSPNKNIVIISSPDLFYYHDSLQVQNISWIIFDFSRPSGEYNIVLNSSDQVKSQNTWHTGQFVYFDVSNLSIGNYFYEIQVEDEEGNIFTKTIRVWVLESHNKVKIGWMWFILTPIATIGSIIYVIFTRKKHPTVIEKSMNPIDMI